MEKRKRRKEEEQNGHRYAKMDYRGEGQTEAETVKRAVPRYTKAH